MQGVLEDDLGAMGVAEGWIELGLGLCFERRSSSELRQLPQRRWRLRPLELSGPRQG